MSETTELCPELPAPPQRIIAFAGGALILGIALAIWIELPSGPQCNAVLTARTTYVSAPRDGRLAELIVVEGQEIRLGDPILRIEDESLVRKIQAKKQEIAALETTYQQALAAADLELNWRMRTLESEICDIQLRSASFLKEKYNFELQRSMLNDVLAGSEFAMVDGNDSLFESVIIDHKRAPSRRMATVLEMELAANAAEVSAAQVEICELRQKQLLELKKTLPQHIHQTQGVDIAEGNVKRAQAELEQLLSEESELTVSSPAIGKVGVFQCRPGDRLETGTPVVELLDEAQRYLLAYVPSSEIAAFSTETEVQVLFPGDQKRTGIITRIAPQANLCSLKDVATTDTTIVVHIEQTGQIWPKLPVGAMAQVRIEQ